MSAVPTLAPDAAIVLGIASTAMPFARTPEDEAERWLRVLRLHGEVGVALQALGVSEGSLAAHEQSARRRHAQRPAERERRARRGRAGQRARRARSPSERGADGVGTIELLLAVMDVYGEDFDRVLRAHGTDRDEVLERLNLQTAPPNVG